MKKKTCSWYPIRTEVFGQEFKTLCGDIRWDELEKNTFRFCPNCGGQVAIYKKCAIKKARGIE